MHFGKSMIGSIFLMAESGIANSISALSPYTFVISITIFYGEMGNILLFKEGVKVACEALLVLFNVCEIFKVILRSPSYN
jgi:hypothetical protein